MKELTIREEYDLLQELLVEEGNFIHNGSSRAVYRLDKNRVLKVAMDRQGRQQNINEINLFRAHGNQHLAEIFAYGKFVVVMEMVDEQDMDEMMSEYDEFDNQEVIKIIDFLEWSHGSTDDNFQLGYSMTRDKLVCYDYGYHTDYENSQLVSGKLYGRLARLGEDGLLQRTSRMLKLLLDKSAKI